MVNKVHYEIMQMRNDSSLSLFLHYSISDHKYAIVTIYLIRGPLKALLLSLYKFTYSQHNDSLFSHDINNMVPPCYILVRRMNDLK